MPKHQHGKDLSSRAVTAAAALTLLTLAGCVGPDFRPLGSGGVGYSEQQLAPNRYMVTFAGSRAIASPEVERYLMRRAAQITLATGYTHFALGPQDLESRTNYVYIGDNFLHGPDYGRRAGLWPEYPNWPQTRYSASAEITLLQANEAVLNPQAIAATSVL